MCAGAMSTGSVSGFDPWKTYHESPAEQAAIKERAKFRDAMKEEYRRIKTNPFNPPQGVIHDPAMQRWFSARVTYAEYLQPSKKGTLVFLLFGGAIAGLYGLISIRRNRLLEPVEKGQLSYRDRALTAMPR
uniref:NADH dehydrogenase [ubiquinone] 1 beta subcomplex subunit 4 n=1 Tax=Schistocephalus solidus TaxID=70667 RepID=A0A0X3PRX1_SCHSO